MNKIYTVILTLVLALTANTASACTGFYQSDVVSGMSRICYYSHLGGTVAITVSSIRICPMTIQVSH